MLLLALGLATALRAHAAPMERRIQLGIAPHAEEVVLRLNGRYEARDSAGSHPVAAKELRLVADGGTLRLGALRLASPARLLPSSAASWVELSDKRYAGTLVLLADEGADTVTVVDELGIETYLLGVLPFEMDPGWPLEALKAQAVVARTFAYTQLGKYRKEGFDLTTDTRSQMYGGRGADTAEVRKAVESTRGEVLGYKGRILNVYYHACCGGHTESPATIWGGDAPPPLRGVRDRYCSKSPLASWTAYVTFDQLAASLEKHRLTGGRLERFRIEARDAAGYVSVFVARIGAERLKVKAAELRAALGSERLKSLRISGIRMLKNGVEFVGGGAGHGVGLCQWGARLQAARGRSYEQILSFYFPGSTLSVIDE